MNSPLTQRQRLIVLAILEVLNMFDGSQVNEMILHAEVNLRIKPNASLAEFDDAMGIVDRNGWATGVEPKFGGKKKWNMNDAGQAARMELAKA